MTEASYRRKICRSRMKRISDADGWKRSIYVCSKERAAGSKRSVGKNNVAQEEISFYILHQANKRIVEAIAKRLGEPLEKFPMNLEEYGNTSSASIPILLDELNRAGKLQKVRRLFSRDLAQDLPGAQVFWNGKNSKTNMRRRTKTC